MSHGKTYLRERSRPLVQPRNNKSGDQHRRPRASARCIALNSRIGLSRDVRRPRPSGSYRGIPVAMAMLRLPTVLGVLLANQSQFSLHRPYTSRFGT